MNSTDVGVIKLAGFLIVAVSSMSGLNYYQETYHPEVCVSQTKVKAITSVRHRHASLLLEDGKTVEVYKVTIKPGDNFCHLYESQK
jgi:hypothetical protein